MNSDHGLGVRATVKGGETDDVTGTVKVRDTVTAERGWYDGFQDAVVDYIERGGFTTGFVQGGPCLDGAGRKCECARYDLGSGHKAVSLGRIGIIQHDSVLSAETKSCAKGKRVRRRVGMVWRAA